MSPPLLLVQLVIFVVGLVSGSALHGQDTCIMRDQIAHGFLDVVSPLAYNGPALVADDLKLIREIKQICGPAADSILALKNGESEPKICCSEGQVNQLKSSLQLAVQLLASCSACFKNFVGFWCQFTCSRDQSTFVDVVKTGKAAGKDYVDTVDFYVKPQFADDLWDSCKDVKFSADNSRAVNLVAAGATNGLSMLRKIGKKIGALNPIQINFPDFQEEPKVQNITRFNPHQFPCDDADYHCTCTDCFKMCPATYPADITQSTCHIGNTSWECIAFSGVVFYAAVVLLILGFSYLRFLVTAARSRRPRVFLSDTEIDSAMPSEYSPLATDESEILSEPARDSQFDRVKDSSWIVDRFLQKILRELGFLCAKCPFTVISISMIVVGVMITGWTKFEVETKPINLWVDKSSKALAEKNFFDENFAPFYRISQFIVTLKDPEASVFDEKILNTTWTIQEVIENIKVPYVKLGSDGEVSDADLVTLDSLCFKPTDSTCATQSFKGWFQDSYDLFSSEPLKHMAECTLKPGDRSCLSSCLQPLNPKLVLGGLSQFNNTDWTLSKALVVTFVLNSSLDEAEIERAAAWENNFIDTIKRIVAGDSEFGINVNDINIAFSSESSVEDELSRDATTDLFTIAISYIAMFLYASMALGKFAFNRKTLANPFRLFVHSRFMLGIGGILIVIASVLASVGLLSYAGQKATLIIAEVIPFLVLAVGVDNIFILVNTFDRKSKGDLIEFKSQYDDSVLYRHSSSVEARISKTMAEVGPSILLSSTCETIAFGLGTAVSMPAVSIFSMYAAVSVFLNFLLQITCFIAFLSLDAKRQERNGVDCFPCITIPDDSYSPLIDGPSQQEADDKPAFLERIMRDYYAPFLLNKFTKPLVLVIFLTLFVFVGMFNLQNVQLGLDQKLALPQDSYLINYFKAIEEYLEVGPPLYLVFKAAPPTEKTSYYDGLDLTSLDDQRKLCGKFLDCSNSSISVLLEMEYRKNFRPLHEGGISTIATPTSVWFDDFVTSLNTIGIPCIAKNGDQEACLIKNPLPGTPIDDQTEDYHYENHVTSCASWKWRDLTSSVLGDGYNPLFSNYLGPNPYDASDEGGLPKDSVDLIAALKVWMAKVPNVKCPSSGKAAYGTSVAIGVDKSGDEYIKGFVLRTYHQTLRTQSDFIEAYAKAKKIALNIMKDSYGIDVDQNSNLLDPVYAYSIFYVFFEQYESIWKLAATLIIFALVSIFVVVVIVLGSPLAAISIIVTVIMMVVNLFGVMAIWDISLNAISTVNLVIAVGIGVEFCVHVARGAVVLRSTSESLAELGSSVISGITITKIIGISVLAFAKSKIFEVFYFRMYLAIVVLGASHGLILLPVILDYVLRSRRGS